jgi:hypothetical protein
MTDREVYFTPPNIIDFVCGSGAFLQSVAAAIITNPPFDSGHIVTSASTRPGALPGLQDGPTNSGGPTPPSE